MEAQLQIDCVANHDDDDHVDNVQTDVTGVAPPQQKVLIKGQLKDGMDLKKLGIKEVRLSNSRCRYYN